MKFYDNDNAMSEVIGVILLVALTVAVSATTAIFLFGYMQNVNKPYFIDITASRINPTTIELMNRGGEDISLLDTSDGNPLKVTIGGVESYPLSGTFNTSIGSTGVFSCPPGARILIIGKFKDNSKHIIFDSSV